MLVYSHRGVCAQAPENTMAAFEAAVALGVDGIETDLRSSADGQVVLFHDRLAPDGRPVSSLTRQELGAQVGYVVPTLASALERHADIRWVLELKSPAALAPTLDILKSVPPANEVLVISFWHQVIAQIPDDGSLRRGVLFSHRPNDLSAALAAIPSGVHTAVWNYEFIDEELLRQAAAAGLQSLVYGPQSPADHADCAAVGLSGVITDHPEYLLPPDSGHPPSKSSGD